MNLQRLSIPTFCLLLLAFMSSCEKDFLDTRIDNTLTEETQSSNYSTLVGYAVAPYTELRNEFLMLNSNLFAPVTDEAVHSNTNAAAVLFTNGSWNPSTNPDNYYSNYYFGIRAANYFLEQSGNYRAWLALNRDTISPAGKTNYTNDTLNMGWYRGEAHILRAWYYLELAKRYGGVPLVTRTLAATENTHIPRSGFDEIIEFIVSEVDQYKDTLQPNWKTSNFTNNDGRITRGAALALKSRALLLAASPLNNPNNDVARWERAAAALNEFLVRSNGIYSLHSNYQQYFLETNTITSAETIWAIRYPAGNNMEIQNYPVGTAGGNSGIAPTQDLVDAYEYTGVPDPANPYANRDPRLGFTVVTNNSTWNSRTIKQAPGEPDDMKVTMASRTGYYLKKFLNDGMNLQQGATKVHHWSVFRYAEILLEYAEAMNEAYGPDDAHGYSMTARQALNAVRSRTGVAMPAVTVTDKTGFRNAVKRERQVELAFENYRYWDLLRWKDAENVLDQPVHGLTITKDGSGQYVYTEKVVENRVFDASKMYRYPFPQAEVIKSNGVLEQNPNW
ncbi:MAG: RagB/SusD family nutrient uptake outer membrane protein [Candidatus Pseudobacter hemicellulosilyticus]|uniref:RagB/SusD family nutrient uptake outer membrane protein n=1 Tax=Candidatus Pseudobacter hemicellulosilyticus TaxID=3121375 RepID=A0AAJ6BDF6_9BACT|nr:MAG: RagB/SusD family nutrient uptake outer membrane protein [Pseudobacter sp.]